MTKRTEILEKWSDKIRKSVLDVLSEGDKTPTTKYLDFMCNMWKITRGCSDRPSTSTQLIKTVQKFDELLPYIKNKDIYSYKGWGHFLKVVEDAHETKMEKEFVRETHVDVLIENDDFILVKPNTHRGSLKYGANTRWCTASKQNPNTFSNYVRNGVLVYLNRKKIRGNKWDKVAFYLRVNGQGPLMNPVEVYCAQDVGQSSNSLLKSDWSVVEILAFQNLVRSVAIKDWRVSQASKSVKEFIKKVHELDIEKTVQDLVIAKEGVPKEYDELVLKFKESVEKFNEKVTLTE